MLFRSHDDVQVRAIGGEQFDIAQGIAIDQQQVGERTRRDHAELTLHVQNFGIDRRGGMQDVERFQDLPAKAELGSLSRMRLSHQVGRSEEHTSELQSLMRISYAVFCLKKKKSIKNQ